MFDATKLIPGKKYPTRDGKSGRYLGELQVHKDHRFVFATTGPNESCESITVHADDGRFSFHYVTSGRDIISDEPIREPVKVKLVERFLVVHADGTLGQTRRDKGNANEAAKCFAALGVYELPAEIEVTPV
jgi:hypothetical protein